MKLEIAPSTVCRQDQLTVGLAPLLEELLAGLTAAEGQGVHGEETVGVEEEEDGLQMAVVEGHKVRPLLQALRPLRPLLRYPEQVKELGVDEKELAEA